MSRPGSAILRPPTSGLTTLSTVVEGPSNVSSPASTSHFDTLLLDPRSPGQSAVRESRQCSPRGSDIQDTGGDRTLGRGSPDIGTGEEEIASERSSGKVLSFASEKPAAPSLSHLFGHQDKSAKKHVRAKRGDGAANDTGRLKHPVIAAEPPSPRLVLTEARNQAWQQQMARASTGQIPGDSEQTGDIGDRDAAALRDPLLDWYSEELRKICSQSLIHTIHQIVALQLVHKASPNLLSEKSSLLPLLFEATCLMAGVCYHVRRAVQAFGRKVDYSKGNRGVPARSARHSSIRNMVAVGGPGARNFAKGSLLGQDPSKIPDSINAGALAGLGRDTDMSRSSLTPPFAPKNADDAFAMLHVEVAQLEGAGKQLSIALRELTGSGSAGLQTGTSHIIPGEDLGRLLDSVGRKAAKAEPGAPSRLQQLFLVLPCLEQAIGHIGTLSYLVNRKQTSSMARVHIDVQRNQWRDQEDMDAGIVNDLTVLDEMDAGFDTYAASMEEQSLPLDQDLSASDHLHGPLDSATASRPTHGSRPESASARRRAETSPGASHRGSFHNVAPDGQEPHIRHGSTTSILTIDVEEPTFQTSRPSSARAAEHNRPSSARARGGASPNALKDVRPPVPPATPDKGSFKRKKGRG